MDPDKNKLLQAIELFQHTHKKVLLLGKKQAVCRAFLTLEKICRDSGAKCHLQKKRDSVTITIVCKGFLLSPESAQIWWLFHKADLLDFSYGRRRIRIDLWFRCWKWEIAK